MRHIPVFSLTPMTSGSMRLLRLVQKKRPHLMLANAKLAYMHWQAQQVALNMAQARMLKANGAMEGGIRWVRRVEMYVRRAREANKLVRLTWREVQDEKVMAVQEARIAEVTGG